MAIISNTPWNQPKILTEPESRSDRLRFHYILHIEILV